MIHVLSIICTLEPTLQILLAIVKSQNHLLNFNEDTEKRVIKRRKYSIED